MTSNFPVPCKTNRLVLLFSKNALSYYLCSATFSAVMTLVTILLNCMFLASVLHQKQMRKCISTKLLIVLSLNDLLQGTLLWPLNIVNFSSFYKMQPNCLIQDSLNFVGYHIAAVTMSAIFLVTLEQFIAILHPYFYIENVTFHRLVGPMLLLNSIILLINIPWAIKLIGMWMVYGKLSFLPLIFMIVIGLPYMHTKIIGCAANVAVKITATNKEEGRQIKSRAKAAKSGLVVLIATLVCYSPSIGYNIFILLSEPTPFMTTYIQTTAEILALLSSVVDPVVYYWRLKNIRTATKNMFHSICKNHNHVHSVTI